MATVSKTYLGRKTLTAPATGVFYTCPADRWALCFPVSGGGIVDNGTISGGAVAGAVMFVPAGGSLQYIRNAGNGVGSFYVEEFALHNGAT